MSNSYLIKTFVATDIPTRYEKPFGGGTPLPVGTENVATYETYDDCKAQMVLYSRKLANAWRPSAVTKLIKAMTSYKMYSEENLLHYIDNNYPNLDLPSK